MRCQDTVLQSLTAPHPRRLAAIPTTTPNTLAIYAAGIADSFRFCQINDEDGEARYTSLLDQYNGYIGLLREIADAAQYMEAYRLSHGPDAGWGLDLPYIYDVCDAIAEGLWHRLGSDDLEHIVKDAIAGIAENAGV
jgi:hypothetical protein